MKFICLLIFLLTFNADGQQTIRFEFEDVCGSPAVESQTYFHHRGTVVGIIDGDSIKVKDTRGKKWFVELAGSDTSRSNDRAKQVLTEMIFGKEVDFIGNPRKKKSKFIEAIVRTDGVEINRYLIENGLAHYRGRVWLCSFELHPLCL